MIEKHAVFFSCITSCFSPSAHLNRIHWEDNKIFKTGNNWKLGECVRRSREVEAFYDGRPYENSQSRIASSLSRRATARLLLSLAIRIHSFVDTSQRYKHLNINYNNAHYPNRPNFFCNQILFEISFYGSI